MENGVINDIMGGEVEMVKEISAVIVARHSKKFWDH